MSALTSSQFSNLCNMYNTRCVFSFKNFYKPIVKSNYLEVYNIKEAIQGIKTFILSSWGVKLYQKKIKPCILYFYWIE